MKVSLVLASLFASALAAPSFVSQHELDYDSRPSEGKSILDAIRERKQFSRFVEILEKEKGLRDELEDRGRENTVFVPTNDAMRKIEDEWREKNMKTEMRDVLKYHIAGDSKIKEDELTAGTLIPTNLRLKSLDDRHQRIRVFAFGDVVYLNMQARIVDANIKAENGVIHGIDHVMIPPSNVMDTLYTVPASFSTFLAGMELTNLASEMERERGITMFAPSNAAWKALGMENLKYLFSCVGQKPGHEGRRREDREDREGGECRGRRDLRKILENHVGREVAYSTDLMQKETTKMRTIGGSDIEVCAVKTKHGERNNGRKDDENRDARDYRFIINKGEARITFADGLASNGAVMVVDNVILADIKLPHAPMTEMA